MKPDPRKRQEILIEAAYLSAGQSLRVSITEEQFRARRAERPPWHLVKLHGSIDQPDTIVLTRLDYARARAERTEMLSALRNEMIDTAFLFVGFSLSDPNFNLIHDDIRLVYGMNLPASYTVQGRRNPVKERYLGSLGVNTVWLDRLERYARLSDAHQPVRACPGVDDYNRQLSPRRRRARTGECGGVVPNWSQNRRQGQSVDPNKCSSNDLFVCRADRI
ncbi:SIR2 family NAD-dependent protein deacylase [Candidatus Mycobacterium methanotrophicum]|uniref:SIR2 family NAD-dependent protein deacylase n=1 Tax=Candidatus Mycobacterium methanotrophicum TaxID=2943498 RepID=UPI001C5A403E|nr:SIR2 family protein [Candidatus Mycobacterium methanotrophicum]